MDKLKQFEAQLPDLMFAWEKALRSGFSVLQIIEATAAMTRTGRPWPFNPEYAYTAFELMETVPYENVQPAAGEFKRVLEEIQGGVSFPQAMDNLLERMPGEDLNLIITTMNVQREIGGNLADILEVIAHVIRQRKR